MSFIIFLYYTGWSNFKQETLRPNDRSNGFNLEIQGVEVVKNWIINYTSERQHFYHHNNYLTTSKLCFFTKFINDWRREKKFRHFYFYFTAMIYISCCTWCSVNDLAMNVSKCRNQFGANTCSRGELFTVLHYYIC